MGVGVGVGQSFKKFIHRKFSVKRSVPKKFARRGFNPELDNHK